MVNNKIHGACRTRAYLAVQRHLDELKKEKKKINSFELPAKKKKKYSNNNLTYPKSSLH